MESKATKPSAFAAAAAEDTRAVFSHHVGAFAEGIDSIMQDYDENSVVVAQGDEFRGMEAIRRFFQAFLEGATEEFWAAFTVQVQAVHGDVAYMVWSAAPFVTRATDTLVIRQGRIAVQTVTLFQV